MKLYQIDETIDNENTAGSKAIEDIKNIAEGMGFEKVNVRKGNSENSILEKCFRQINYIGEWKNVFQQVCDNSIVLLQHPFRSRQLNRDRVLNKLKKKKNIKFVSIIHDVEALRKIFDNSFYRKEFITMLEIADVLIVHNNNMAKYFREIGVPDNKIVVLTIFDYLQKGKIDSEPKFSKKINIAGNLDVNKSPYISELTKLKNVSVQLYGPNYDRKMEQCSHISYGGSFPPDKVPQMLKEGFGLVWDGNSIDGCRGATGEYLRYNNPHKLSLYLSSGLPVIIWKEAAEAEFVIKNQVGIAVNSLEELTDIFQKLTQQEYERMVYHVKLISNKLRNGQFTRNALIKALNILHAEN